MTRILSVSLCVLVALMGGAALGADRCASADDGKAMRERAVTALKADPTAALKEFNDEKNKQFRDRDLFVFCFSLPDGNFTAFQSPVMLGTDVRELKYQDKPGTKTTATKQSLEPRIGKQACGVTYFK